MDQDRILIKTYQALSVVGGVFSGYQVSVSFRYPPHNGCTYTIVARNDKVAADKGLRRFISEMAQRNEQNRK